MDFLTYLKQKRNITSAESAPTKTSFFNSPVLTGIAKKVPSLMNTLGNATIDLTKRAVKNPVQTASRAVNAVGNFVSNSKTFQKMLDDQAAASKTVMPGDNIDVFAKPAANLAKWLAQSTVGGLSSLGKSVWDPNKGQPNEFEKSLLGYNPKSIQEELLNPTLKYADEQGSGPVEKFTLGTTAVVGGVLMNSPFGLPARNNIARELSKDLVNSVDRAEIQTTLRPLGLSEDAARELSEGIRLINTETGMKAGARKVEIQQIIDDVLRKNAEASKGAAESVVQVVTKNGDNVFYTVSPEDLKVLKEDVIDGTGRGIAGNNIDGNIYHLTAKTPAAMLEKSGWRNGGQKTLDDIMTMITPKKRVAIRDTQGRFLGSFMDEEVPAYKIAANQVSEEQALAENAKRYASPEQLIAARKDVTYNEWLTTSSDAKAQMQAVNKEARAITNPAERAAFIEKSQVKLRKGFTQFQNQDEGMLTRLWRKANNGVRSFTDENGVVFNTSLDDVSRNLNRLFDRKFDIFTTRDTRALGAQPGDIVYGRSDGNSIYLLERNKLFSEAVANHEGWHWFKRNLSSSKRKELDALEEELMTARPDLVAKIKGDYPNATPKELAEEVMAEEFARFVRTGKTFSERAKIFFTDAKEALMRLFNVREDVLSQARREFRNVKKTLKKDGAVAEVGEGANMQRLSAKEFKNFTDLSTKLLAKLEGKTTVSKQFISDLTNSPDLKQPERELFRSLLEGEGDKINVSEFADRVKTELLPLDANDVTDGPMGSPRYESINLPDELRGPVYNYQEFVYESPIKTSAGGVHFGSDAENYFAHTRIEDTANKFTPDGQPDSPTGVRRVLEVQSDLFQKGRLEGENVVYTNPLSFIRPEDIAREREIRNIFNDLGWDVLTRHQNPNTIPASVTKGLGGAKQAMDLVAEANAIDTRAMKAMADYNTKRPKDLAKLEPYRNTWHERVVREEVKKAAQDGKTKLQFPTGETAMKIEGLGERGAGSWVLDNGSNPLVSDLKAGKTIYRSTNNNGVGTRPFGESWIITDVLGDGKFKAIPESQMPRKFEYMQNGKTRFEANGGQVYLEDGKYTKDDWLRDNKDSSFAESFDISGKVDTENPIYKFYEKEVSKYLKNKYGAQRVTDAQGVSWWEVPLKEEYGTSPVDAFKQIKNNPSENEYDSILTQLSGAEKGERILNTKDGYADGMSRKGSTFPQWMPEELRSRELFDKYMDGRTGSMDDFKKTYPAGSRLARIDAAVRNRVFEKTGDDVRLMPDTDTYYDSLADEYMELSATEVKNRQQQARSIRVGTASQGMPQDILDRTKVQEMFSLDKSVQSSDSLVNLTKLDVSPEAKQFLEATVEDVKPYAEKKVGETLTNKEMLEYAEKNAKMLERAVGREQTMAWEAAMFNARENLARLAERGIVDKEYIDALVTVKALGADLGRKLQSLSVKAQPNEGKALDAILEEVLKVADNADEVLKAAENVDFKNYKEAAGFYRKFVKPRMSEWIDMLRYNSMLSSPLTHIVNIFSNLVNSAIVGTTEKLTVGAFDMVRGVLTGSERERFAGEAGVFLKEYMSNVGEATKRFAETIKGERAISNLDTRSIPLATSGPAKVVEDVLTVPMKFLEAADQFFTALTEAGELGALKYRQSKGVKVSAPIVKAQEAAQYRLYRQELFSEEQGSVLNAVDHVTNTLYNLRNSENPIISNIFKFTVPFLRTPTNIFKQGIEYSPLGVTTLVGAKDKELQLAKAAIGTTIFAGAAVLLASDRITWGEPTSDKERTMWRDAGKQPYSVKIGDTWVQYQKLPPPIAFPLSMVSVINDTQKTRKIEDSTIEMILGGIAKYGSFLADQSYAKSIGDLLSAVKGGESDWARVVGNVPQQLVPYRALGGWLSKLLDNVQRKPDPEGTFIEKQVQLLMMNIPGLSDNAPARTNQFGEEVTNDQNIVNAFSPVRISEEKPKGIEILTKYMNNKLESAKTKDARAKFKEDVFLPIQEMGKEEALKKVEALSDEEYEMYKSVRTSWRSSNMSTVRDYLDYDPREAVSYLRSLPPEEAKRILGLLTDAEYALYETGKGQK